MSLFTLDMQAITIPCILPKISSNWLKNILVVY